MSKDLFIKFLSDEIDAMHQEKFNNPSVWFGVGLGAGCAIKAYEKALAEDDVEKDPNEYVEKDGVKFYGQ